MAILQGQLQARTISLILLVSLLSKVCFNFVLCFL